MTQVLSIPGIVRLEDIGKEKWDLFVKNHPEASLYHLSDWAEVFSEVYDLRPHYLAYQNQEGSITAVLPLIQQKSILFGNQLNSLPFFINYAGTLANDTASKHALHVAALDLSKQLDVDRIELRGMTPLDIGWQCRENKVCMQLALPDTADELLKALGAKRRSQIKRPERENIEIVHGGIECVDDFYDVIANNMRDLGSPVHSKIFYKKICQTFSSNTHIVLIKKDGIAVAAAFLIGHKSMLEIPWASSLREYNPIGVNMRLYWEVLDYAIKRGYKTFDFGRSNKDSGTYRFKKQWGAEAVQCYWHYWSKNGSAGDELSNDNPKYQLAIKLWQRMPLSLTKIVGPRVVRYLP